MSSVRTFARSTAVAGVALILVVGASFAHDAALVRTNVVIPVVNVDTEDVETGDVGLETGDAEDLIRPEIDDQIENVGDSSQPVKAETAPKAEAPAKATKPAKVAKTAKIAKVTKAAKTTKAAEAADADDANELGDANDANDQGDANDVSDTENSQSGDQQDSTDTQQAADQQGDSSDGGGD